MAGVRPITITGTKTSVGQGGTGRNGSIDVFRYLGACGIVLFHMKAVGGAIGYSALPLFTFLSIYFLVQSHGRRSLAEDTRRRALRLLVPFAIWSLLYLSLKLAEVVVTGASPATEFSAFMLLTGPALHLWFLPFLFVASLAVSALLPDRRAWDRMVPWLAVLTPVGVGIAIWAVNTLTLPPPFIQYLFVTPAVLLGMTAGVMMLCRAWRAALVLLGLTMVVTVVTNHQGWTIAMGQTVIGVISAVITLALPVSGTALTRQLGAISMGVYLMHPMIISILARAIPDALLSAAPPLVLPLLVIALSSAISLLILRVPRLSAWLGFGE